MSDQLISENRLSRKQFLLGTAGVIGTSAALSPAHAVASILNDNPRLRVARLDGGRLVDAGTALLGDSQLSEARATLRASGEGSVVGISVQGAHSGKASKFVAWSKGAPGAAFAAPISGEGFTLVAEHANGAKQKLVLRSGFGSGPKLSEGVYVLVEGSVNLSKVGYDEATKQFSFPKDRQHFVLTLERAV